MQLQRIIRIFLILLCALILQEEYSYSQERLKITHGPYLVEPAENAITVAWFTNKACLSWVEYSGDKSYGTFPTWGGYPKIAQSSNNGLIDANTTRHAIRITNLEKGTKYRYRIASKEILKFNPYEVLYGDSVVGDVLGFETLDPEKENFSFGVVTDVHGRAAVLDTLLQIAELDFMDMMFYTGDILSWIGDEKRIFNGFLDVSVKHFAKEKPFVYIRGNHETRGPSARNLMSYFPRSNGKYYHSFTQGDVHFIMLDSGEDKADSHPVYAGLVEFDKLRDEQSEWLKEEVQSESFKKALYKIVMVHIPLFSGSNGHGASEITKKWGPILNEADIDLMISGHRHRFSRIEPVEGKNRFPVVVLGQDMFLRTDVSNRELSIIITKMDSSVVDKFVVPAINR
ncbi:metallophosphoesterase [candidate division KSB1 bacterium]